MTTRSAILTYIRADPEPRPLVQVIRYMRQMHGVRPAATRQALYMLCKAGGVGAVGGSLLSNTGIAPGWLSLNKATPTDHTA